MLPAFECPALNHSVPAVFQELERGDIISFKTNRETLLKRIVGLPGETIVIWHGQVYVMPSSSYTVYLLKEPYLPEGTTTWYFNRNRESFALKYQVPKKTFFVLGDRRKGSADSRAFVDDSLLPTPFVPKYAIEDQLIVSLSRFGPKVFLRRPEYRFIPIPRDLLTLCPEAAPCLREDELTLPGPPKRTLSIADFAFYHAGLGQILALKALYP